MADDRNDVGAYDPSPTAAESVLRFSGEQPAAAESIRNEQRLEQFRRSAGSGICAEERDARARDDYLWKLHAPVGDGGAAERTADGGLRRYYWGKRILVERTKAVAGALHRAAAKRNENRFSMLRR